MLEHTQKNMHSEQTLLHISTWTGEFLHLQNCLNSVLVLVAFQFNKEIPQITVIGIKKKNTYKNISMKQKQR